MAIKQIGTAGNGSKIFRIGGQDETAFFLTGQDDFVSKAASGWLGLLNADTGSNKVTLRSDVNSMILNGGGDILKALGNTRITSADLGKGADRATIANNAFVNLLDAGNGNDNVKVKGNAQVNMVNLGNGNDTLTIGGSARVESLIMYDGTASVTVNGDARLTTARFGDDDDTVVLNDNASAFLLKLGAGDNSVTSQAGFIETIYSFQGSNTLDIGLGGVQQVTLNGAGGTHFIQSAGWLGQLQVWDDSTAVVVTGVVGAGSLQMYGNIGHSLSTGAGTVVSAYLSRGEDTVVIGSGGIGLLSLNRGADDLTVNGAAEFVGAGQGADMIRVNGFVELAKLGDGADTYVGSATEDTVKGGAGSDTLNGRGGEDILIGGSNSDVIKGGDGDDLLKGGSGADNFVFDADDDRDVIQDFEIGIDLIDLSGTAVTFGDLAFDQADGVATVSFDNTVLVMTGLTEVEIDNAANFIFA